MPLNEDTDIKAGPELGGAQVNRQFREGPTAAIRFYREAIFLRIASAARLWGEGMGGRAAKEKGVKLSG